MKPWRKVLLSIALALAGSVPGMPALAGAEASTVPTEGTQVVDRRPLLMISIDGLRPDAVLEADKYGLKIPVLRSFLTGGSYAQAVVNVNPTVTNPNHTTLVTGVSPSEHGIYNNRPFAPTAKLPQSYDAYAQIKAPTLWGAAKAAGLSTASIFWPVTRQASDIDFNVIEGNDEDDRKIADHAIALIEQKRPDLLTVHFVSFDHRQHEFGPFSAEGNAALERIDAEIGRILAAQRKVRPETIVAIVSDHGFDTARHQMNLNAALADASFIRLRGEGKDMSVSSWQAFAWYVGGSAMIVLRNPAQRNVGKRVFAYLRKLSEDPANGIERVYERKELAGRGIAPSVEFVVAFKRGFRMGNPLTGPLVATSTGGAHGAYSTAMLRPDMHSAFFIAGPGVAAGRNVGVIDMRQIAPTLAQVLRLSLPTASAPALSIRAE